MKVLDDSKAANWVYISAFMAITAIGYAAILSHDTERRIGHLLRGYIAGAVAASLAGTAAYFHLLGGTSDLFLLYGRARGTFNDPNVLGAFLVLPALLLFQRILIGGTRHIVADSLMLLTILLGLFLSFSRAAWGQFALAAALLMALGFITAPSVRQRARIITVAVLGSVAAVVLVGALLSLPAVSDLFNQRVSLDQSYDEGHFGRFGRYILGAELGLERPFGIGPLQFWRFFGEDAHNTYLNAFMSGGWISGFAYLTLTALTLVHATRFLRVRTPWMPTYHVVYAAFLGVAGESAIIDSDHWRHYFLIIGALWGMMAATRPYLAPAPIRRPGSPMAGMA